MLEIALLLILIISFVFFLHEGIIAPNKRFLLRNDLFILRDSLSRAYLIDKTVYEIEFQLVDERINTCLHHLRELNLYSLFRFSMRLKKEENLKRIFTENVEKFNAVKSTEAVKINEAVSGLVYRAFFVNSMPLLIQVLIVLVPIYLIVSLLGLFKELKPLEFIKKKITQITYTPDNRFESLGLI